MYLKADRSLLHKASTLESGRLAITLQLNIATASKHSTDVSLVSRISLSSAGVVCGAGFAQHKPRKMPTFPDKNAS